MHISGIFFMFFITADKWSCLFASQIQDLSNRTARIDQLWEMGNTSTIQELSPSSSGNQTFTTLPTSVRDNKNAINARYTKVPQINFYSSIPNALGVIGQGIIWLREISAALGTPIPIWIFTIPFFILGVGLFFIPNNQNAGPIFYPDGNGLAVVPRLPDMEDMMQLLPNFVVEKWG